MGVFFLNVVCFWFNSWCGKWGPTYVEKLYKSLQKNTTIPFNFYCLTDQPNKVINPIKFEPNLEWNLNKFLVFNPALKFTGKILTIDLDTVILGNVDFLLEEKKGFWTNKNMKGYDMAGGGIVYTDISTGQKLFRIIYNDYQKILNETKGSERLFIRKYVSNPNFWQNHYKGIYSWKNDCRKGIPEDCVILNGHGSPKLHEISELKGIW